MITQNTLLSTIVLLKTMWTATQGVPRTMMFSRRDSISSSQMSLEPKIDPGEKGSTLVFLDLHTENILRTPHHVENTRHCEHVSIKKAVYLLQESSQDPQFLAVCILCALKPMLKGTSLVNY